MWDCVKCGTSAIAHGLYRCPQCREEPDMPKTTADGGGTNGAAGHPGYGEEPAGTEHPADGTPSPEISNEPETETKGRSAKIRGAKDDDGPQDVTGSGGIKLPTPGAKNG